MIGAQNLIKLNVFAALQKRGQHMGLLRSNRVCTAILRKSTIFTRRPFVRQAHAVGARVMLQVTTVAQAVQAAERAVDVIIAQGGESGGYCGEVSTMALVPQVVDAVSPIPVVASGGSLREAYACSLRRSRWSGRQKPMVRVNTVHPGVIDTPIWTKLPVSAGRNVPIDPTRWPKPGYRSEGLDRHKTSRTACSPLTYRAI